MGRTRRGNKRSNNLSSNRTIKKLSFAGVSNIPARYVNKVKGNLWPYVVAKEYSLDPDVVMSWDNDSIIEALAALKEMGVIK